jgi:hypothetical protein
LGFELWALSFGLLISFSSANCERVRKMMATPEDKNMLNSRGRLFFSKSRRRRLLYISKEIFTAKPAANIWKRLLRLTLFSL